MSERLIMEGKLLQLEREAKSLRYRMEGLCSLVRGHLNTALCPAPEEMDIAEAAAHMDELVMAQAELLNVLAQIKKLGVALGR